MTWLQIELPTTPQALADIEDVFYRNHAVSITLLSDADEPVLEPAPGEVPLWTNVRLQALFPIDVDIAQLRLQLTDIQAWHAEQIKIDFVAEQDWQVAATNHAVNQIFAERLWLLPKDVVAEPPNDTGASGELVLLRLEPGLAFGSGSHPTTRLCLTWLAQHLGPGQRVLDFGCGSGILGIAAALLGADVIGVDHDDQAVLSSQQNAAYNNVSEQRFKALPSRAWQCDDYLGYFDVVVANILAAPLQQLAEEFERVLKPKGKIVLSGVLQDQAQDVMSAYEHSIFDTPEIEAGWACLVGSRNAAT